MTIFYNIMEVKSPCCKNILHIYKAMYSKITNPKTNRSVDIRSSLGKRILIKYLAVLRGGAAPPVDSVTPFEMNKLYLYIPPCSDEPGDIITQSVNRHNLTPAMLAHTTQGDPSKEAAIWKRECIRSEGGCWDATGEKCSSRRGRWGKPNLITEEEKTAIERFERYEGFAKHGTVASGALVAPDEIINLGYDFVLCDRAELSDAHLTKHIDDILIAQTKVFCELNEQITHIFSLPTMDEKRAETQRVFFNKVSFNDVPTNVTDVQAEKIVNWIIETDSKPIIYRCFHDNGERMIYGRYYRTGSPRVGEPLDETVALIINSTLAYKLLRTSGMGVYSVLLNAFSEVLSFFLEFVNRDNISQLKKFVEFFNDDMLDILDTSDTSSHKSKYYNMFGFLLYQLRWVGLWDDEDKGVNGWGKSDEYGDFDVDQPVHGPPRSFDSEVGHPFITRDSLGNEEYNLESSHWTGQLTFPTKSLSERRKWNLCIPCFVKDTSGNVVVNYLFLANILIHADYNGDIIRQCDSQSPNQFKDLECANLAGTSNGVGGLGPNEWFLFLIQSFSTSTLTAPLATAKLSYIFNFLYKAGHESGHALLSIELPLRPLQSKLKIPSMDNNAPPVNFAPHAMPFGGDISPESIPDMFGWMMVEFYCKVKNLSDAVIYKSLKICFISECAAPWNGSHANGLIRASGIKASKYLYDIIKREMVREAS